MQAYGGGCAGWGCAGWACLLGLGLLLAASEVRGEELTDADLVGPMLQMLSTPASGRRFLSVCDLAVSLLQAVEATKADRVQHMKHKKERILDRYRRADTLWDAEDEEDAAANPVLVRIVRAYLLTLKEDLRAHRRRARMESALARAQLDLEAQLVDAEEPEEDVLLMLMPSVQEEDQQELAQNEIDGGSSTVIQRIFRNDK